MIRYIVKRCYLTIMALLGYVLLLPVWRWIRATYSSPEYRILNYHSVNEHRCFSTNVDPLNFEQHCALYARHRHVFPLSDLVARAFAREKLDTRSMAITFDDGYADNAEVAMPILEKYGLTATFYLTAGFVGSERLLPHDERHPTDDNRLVSWPQVATLIAHGMSIGSHGMTHSRFQQLNDDQLKAEIYDSKARIESSADSIVTSIAYPYGRHGDFDERTKQLSRDAGYTNGLSAQYGWNNAHTDPFRLRRIGVEQSDTLFTIMAKLNGAMDLLLVMETPIARRLVGYANRLLSSSS